jgi:hypothetical protein
MREVSSGHKVSDELSCSQRQATSTRLDDDDTLPAWDISQAGVDTHPNGAARKSCDYPAKPALKHLDRLELDPRFDVIPSFIFIPVPVFRPALAFIPVPFVSRIR